VRTVTNAITPDDLPHFDRPPVVETVLGVQFDALPGLTNAHLGVFWKQLGPDWPNLSDAPPIPPQFERFGETERWTPGGLQLRLIRDVDRRIQIRNATNDRMIQIQNGRFHYNWLGHEGVEYPRYRKVRPEFDKHLDAFRAFLAAESLGQLRPNQWEVTYVNHIPRGSVWQEPRDWASLFPTLTVPPTRLSSTMRLESISGEWHFEIEPRRGRLHVHLQHMRLQSPDGLEVLRLTLTARGPAGDGETVGVDLNQGLNLGRKAVVTAFRDLTSEAAHEYWGLVYEHT